MDNNELSSIGIGELLKHPGVSEHALRATSYVRNYDTVEGWFGPGAADVIAACSLFQMARGMSGNLLEIGVHHGKSYLLLLTQCRSGETCLAVDVFDDQHLNVDQSGHGSREKLEENIARLAPWSGEMHRAIKASSLDLKSPELLDEFGPFRIVSIDGGHTNEATSNDLRLAQDLLLDGGIAILDDFLNYRWLGVISGFFSYNRDPASELVPVFYYDNKLLLAKGKASAETYKEFILANYPLGHGHWDVELADHSIISIGEGLPRPLWDVIEGAKEEPAAPEKTKGPLKAGFRRFRESVRRLAGTG